MSALLNTNNGSRCSSRYCQQHHNVLYTISKSKIDGRTLLNCKICTNTFIKYIMLEKHKIKKGLFYIPE